MNLSHAAALALVGWYLMTPPISPKTEIKGSYDSADACRKGQIQLVNTILAFAAQESDESKRNFFVPSWRDAMNAVCVSTDDPRLKEK